MAGYSKIAADQSPRCLSAGKSGMDGSIEGTRVVKLPVRKNDRKANNSEASVAEASVVEEPYDRSSNNAAEFYNGEDRSTLYGNSTASVGWSASTTGEDCESSQGASTGHSTQDVGASGGHFGYRYLKDYLLFSGSEFQTDQNFTYPKFVSIGGDAELDSNEISAPYITLDRASKIQIPESYYYSQGFTPPEVYYSVSHHHEDFALGLKFQEFRKSCRN